METILFGAQWCNPCKQLKSYAESNNITFTQSYDIDTDEGVDNARKYSIRSVPTVVVIEDGGESNRIIGFDREKLNKLKEGE